MGTWIVEIKIKDGDNADMLHGEMGEYIKQLFKISKLKINYTRVSYTDEN